MTVPQTRRSLSTAVDENNASSMSWHNGVKSTTGELTAYDGKYSAAPVPWIMTAPADSHA